MVWLEEKIGSDSPRSMEATRWAYRMGAICAVAGAVLGGVGNLLHPETSGPGDPVATARVVADSEIWIPLHLGLVVSFVLMLLGLVAIHDSFAGGLPRALARFGLVAALIGTAGGVVILSIDGFAAKHLADAWASAPLAARPEALASFRAEDAIDFALLTPLNLVFGGFTFVFFGLANALSNVYPRWLGWAAVIGGVGGAISGVIQAYMGEPTAISTAVGIAAPTIFTLWLLIIGVLLFRRGAPGSRPGDVSVGA